MDGWWTELLEGVEQTARAGKILLSDEREQRPCIEICGSASVDGEYRGLVSQVEELVAGVTGLGADILVSGPRSGHNLARRAAECAGKRAIVIEDTQANLAANRNGFGSHQLCVSTDGRHWLASQRSGATIVLPGGTDDLFTVFNRLVSMRTGALPTDELNGHHVFLVGKQGALVAELLRQSERQGMLPPHELGWFTVLVDPRQILPLLQNRVSAVDHALRRVNQAEQIKKYVEECCVDIANLQNALAGHENAIGVYGSGAIRLPEQLCQTIRAQLRELLGDLQLAVCHGGFGGVMKLAAEIAHELTVSIALRARIEGRPQEVNDFHSRMVYCTIYALREAGLLGPRNTHDFYYPTGSGGYRELFNPHGCRRVIVNIDGFWEPLRALLDHAVDTGLMDPDERPLFPFVKHPLEAV